MLDWNHLTQGVPSFYEMELPRVIYASAIFIMGYWVSKWLSNYLGHIVRKHISKHGSVVCQRLLFYGAMLLFLIAALQQLGFKLGVLLGAAGVFTVGIGFAAQTSLANVVSGIFLLIERPFKIGDAIIVKGYTGVVESIDLLSTQLCTAENTLVRIPNQNIMQVEIVNLSYFKKRRVDLTFGIAYKEDIEKIRDLLLKIAAEDSLVLKDPPPVIAISDFGASATHLTFSVWGLTANYNDIKNGLQDKVKAVFEKEDIEIPPPQVTLQAVTETTS